MRHCFLKVMMIGMLCADATAVFAQETMFQTIQQLRTKGQLEQAKAMGALYLKSHPKDVDVLLLMGLMAYQKKDYSTARLYFNQVLSLNPQYVDATLGLIHVDLAVHHMSGAKFLFEALEKQAPDRQEVRDLRAIFNPSQVLSPPVLVSILPVPPVFQKQPGQAPLATLRMLMIKGQLESALAIGQAYLKSYPQDGDVMFFMGLIFDQQHDYQKATIFLKRTLVLAPRYTDAKVALFRVALAQHHFIEARRWLSRLSREAPKTVDLIALTRALRRAENEGTLQQIDGAMHREEDDQARRLILKALKTSPDDPAFLIRQSDRYKQLHQYARAAQLDQRILAMEPSNEEAKQSLKTIATINPHLLNGINELGTSNEVDYVTDRHEVWQYSTAYYTRDFPQGQLYLSLNNASRFGVNASQGAVGLTPILNRHAYMNLVLGYANQPLLFPMFLGGAEGFYSNKIAEFSAGCKYSYILPNIAFTQYTGSVSKEWKSLWISFRPIYYVPQNGLTSLLYTATLIKFYGGHDAFINVTGGVGTSPNLANLTTINFLIIRNHFVTFTVQVPLWKHQLMLNFGGDYQHWVFVPGGHIRDIEGGMLGLNYRFEDAV